MRVLDLFCKAGGASMGIHQAYPNAEITGVDIQAQPRYPFRFVQADAMSFDLSGFDFIWASPPCQRYSRMQKIRKREHPDLIPGLRRILQGEGRSGCWWVIENVPGAPLINPVMLCGVSFGINSYRHRIFESNLPLKFPEHLPHRVRTERAGRIPPAGEFISVAGHFPCVERVRQDWGVPWMTRDEIAECIPPAYSRYIAEQFSLAR